MQGNGQRKSGDLCWIDFSFEVGLVYFVYTFLGYLTTLFLA
jgi:hypothetical protein